MLFNTFFWCITSIPKKVINIFSTSAIIFITCLNRHHTRNNIRYKGNINNTSVIIFFNKQLSYFLMAFCVDQVYFLGDFRKLNKTPSNGTCLGEPPGGFCDFDCSCFWPHWRFFISWLFNVIPHPSVSYRHIFTPILYFQPSSSQSDLWHFHFNFSRLFIFTTSAMVLSDCFIPMGIFYPTLLRFVTQMRAGTPHPGSSSVPSLAKLSLPADAWPWTIDVWIKRPLIYQLHLCHKV